MVSKLVGVSDKKSKYPCYYAILRENLGTRTEIILLSTI